jgi:hypothetical protein
LLLALGVLLMLGSTAAAGHRKAKRSHRSTTTIAQASRPAAPAHVQIGGDPTDPIGGLGTIPHKKRKH